nr:hypothetical protein [Actinoplanes polyasparticus]
MATGFGAQPWKILGEDLIALVEGARVARRRRRHVDPAADRLATFYADNL